MPRCTSTNLFASYDEPVAEIEDESLESGQLSVTVHVIRPCAECGEDMSDYTYDLSLDDVTCPVCSPGDDCGGHYGEHRELPEGKLPSDPLPPEHPDYNEQPVELDIESSDADVSEGGGSRYAKNLFTCTYSATVRCGCCDEAFEVEASDSAAASYFEVLV